MAAESIKEISFKVHRPASGTTSMMTSEVSFKLGLGPCGRFVESLKSSIGYHGVTITQVSYPEDAEPLRRRWMKACLDGADNEHIERILSDIAAQRLTVETKEFFYKLEDVRGRIVVIR